jgi:2,4-dienoyl-CoA reductase-like NADH-dependent reductase (Old Yellow Enzyme family)
MLFDAYSARTLKLANRRAMAPMTRSRSTASHTPVSEGYTDYPALTS